jgi:ferrous iron transport protein B
VAIAKETNWKWATFSVVGSLCFAFLMAVAVYHSSAVFV